MPSRGEFELIEALFAPLAAGDPGTFGLKNDAALISHGPDESLVATADCLVEGVHFRAGDAGGDVARKALRVNLSDLAAMGARPRGYLLTLSLPTPLEESWLEAFAVGLALDQAEFGLTLLGGDTTRTPGPRTLSVTALGTVPAGRCLQRGTARPDDLIVVSGHLGDGALGLKVLEGELDGLDELDKAALAARYRLPQPRLALGRALLMEDLASAALDISDGLLGDLGHITKASGLAAEIKRDAIPLSPEARRALDLAAGAGWADILTGGDDYELLFTLSPERREELQALSDKLDLPLSEIGRIAAGQGAVTLRDAKGRAIDLPTAGWQHF